VHSYCDKAPWAVAADREKACAELIQLRREVAELKAIVAQQARLLRDQAQLLRDHGIFPATA
jgi:hypothetical protein